MEKLRPIWGFTWRGWVLTIVAIVLFVLLVSGFNAQLYVQRAICDAFGVSAMIGYTQWVLIPHWLWTTMSYVPDPALGILQCSLLLVAIHLHPGRARVVPIIVCGVWGVLGQPFLRYLFVHPPVGGRSAGWILYFAVSAALLLWVTRSWLVGVGFCTLVAVHYFLGDPMWNTFPPWVWNLAWNTAFFALLLAWAIRARRRYVELATKEDPCPACGYELAGLDAAAPCPECGATRSLPQ